jgi:predicted nucleic acid-binding protein
VTYVVDTTLLVDHLRARDGATRAFDAALQSGRRVTGSVLSRVELRRDARPHELEAIETVEILLDWVPVDHAIASAAADFAASHGDRVTTVDYVIAATTQRLNADLLTREVDRFPMFPDLKPPY